MEAATATTETSDCAPSTISAECLTIITTARVSGAMRLSIEAGIMTATASPRLFQSLDWTRSSSGQVATTMMVAQSSASRNGFRIQKLPPISRPIKSSCRVVWIGGCEE